MFNNASSASAAHSLTRAPACVRAREGAHLWANDSLDVLQGRVGGRRGAVRSGARCAVAMMTGLPLPHRSVGQVTLEGETERQVLCCNHSHCSVDPKKPCGRPVISFKSVFFSMPRWGGDASRGQVRRDGDQSLQR